MMYTHCIDGVEVEVSEEYHLSVTARGPVTESEIRDERNYLISETDVWALSDRTMTDAQTAYRQALRDITGQAGFPTDITWPTKPE